MIVAVPRHRRRPEDGVVWLVPLGSFGFFGEHADGGVYREARVLPAVHGLDEVGGDFLVTEEEIEDAAAEGVLEQEDVDGGYG